MLILNQMILRCYQVQGQKTLELIFNKHHLNWRILHENSIKIFISSRMLWQVKPCFHIIVTVGDMPPIDRQHVPDPFLQSVSI